MKFGSLFSGIGGMDLGLERVGMSCAWQVEINDYATRVLKKHWPKTPKYRDICKVGKHNLEAVDLICGGFPCQDISAAGNRKGITGSRSGLWQEFARIIKEMHPAWVLIENVEGLRSRGLEHVLCDLSEGGYDAEWDCFPATVSGAPHLRKRLYIIAYPHRVLGEARIRFFDEDYWKKALLSENHRTLFDAWMATEPAMGRMGNGFSNTVDRLRCLGNAVVPHVAELIGKRIYDLCV